MTEIDNYNACEAMAIGDDIKSIVCEYLGCSTEATEQQIDWMIYKGTDCGAWFKFTETGVQIGSIVEGSDATFDDVLNYPFTVEQFGELVDAINAQACDAWQEVRREVEECE